MQERERERERVSAEELGAATEQNLSSGGRNKAEQVAVQNKGKEKKINKHLPTSRKKKTRFYPNGHSEHDG